MSRLGTAVAAFTLISAPTLRAQTPDTSPQFRRPQPYPVMESAAFSRAVARGTRTRSGQPGARYWQQWAEYRLQADLDTATHRLTGRGAIRYTNRSPDTLRSVFLHLYQNLFAPGEPRNEKTPVTKGMELARVSAQGRDLALRSSRDTGAGYSVDATRMRIRLPTPLPPAGTLDLDLQWSFTVPENGAPRMGRDSSVYFLAYWYPQMAVYDDLNGWQIDPYLGNAEFYMGYGDYDVTITVPAGWLVGATGELTNPAEVLQPSLRNRLALAQRVDTVVHVVRATERGAGRDKATLGGTGAKLSWRFQAKNVRDFAWGTSDEYLWDAARVTTGTSRGRAAQLVFTFHRPGARNWEQSAHYGRHSVAFLSRLLWPYPYPQMTVVDGIQSCGGMEYPMITCIGGNRDTISLYGVTVHEIGHMWFPMQVGSDEKRYSWQDEGLTRYNQAQGMREFFRGYDRLAESRQRYFTAVRNGQDGELMRHGDLYPYDSPAFGVASYDKMAVNLAMLRSLLGDETFLRAYREYGRRWLNKHPSPYDFWNTFEEIAGRDLDWFWRPWWFETWSLDQAIADVQPLGGGGDSLRVVIEDRGLVPMPVRLGLTRADGRVERVEIPVDIWLGGARRHAITVSARPSVVRVEIDPEAAFADTDRSNQVWRAEAASP